jgi:hypothetical protein
MNVIFKKIKLLAICCLSSIGIVVILYQLSRNLNHYNNQFNRLFPPHFISYYHQTDLKFNSFYLAGFTKTHIFLGNSTAPGFMLVSNYELSDTHHIILQIPSNIAMVFPAARLYIDSPDIFIMEGRTPSILHGIYPDFLLHEYPNNQIYFNAASIISNRSLLVRAFDKETAQNMLMKSVTRPNAIIRSPGALIKMGDGIFSLDGTISRDQYNHHFTYVYFYRNEFISLDSNLNILLKGKTIDSISTPQIKISEITSEGITTLSAPPLTVNKTSCADSNYLFVDSKLRARNQDEESFEASSVIDIYSLRNGEYLYSFYVPDHNHVKMKNFQVYNHRLVALYEHTLMTFSLNF